MSLVTVDMALSAAIYLDPSSDVPVIWVNNNGRGTYNCTLSHILAARQHPADPLAPRPGFPKQLKNAIFNAILNNPLMVSSPRRYLISKDIPTRRCASPARSDLGKLWPTTRGLKLDRLGSGRTPPQLVSARFGRSSRDCASQHNTND
jgi:hypothetical protein